LLPKKTTVTVTTAARLLKAAHVEVEMHMIEWKAIIQKERLIPMRLFPTMNTRVEAIDATAGAIKAVTMTEATSEDEKGMIDEENELMTGLMIEVVEVEAIGQEMIGIKDRVEGTAATGRLKVAIMKMSMDHVEAREIRHRMEKWTEDHTIVMIDIVQGAANHAARALGILNRLLIRIRFI
jgi:hypothetical protein